ncbi:outer membrane protein assembly factor BamE [Cupriavidus sp. AU9028]|uniref:outer membrane protein assembly factor BamE n=1 Tax=Cupriavidus sp. AU9028 TaxID=2871157 RepID=UPI001C97CE75|nr:outer membrane protein assembly factor BamE [Cupriavidus sp. AU9028]
MDSKRPTGMRLAAPLLTALLAATTLVTAACSTYDSTSRKVAEAITPYRINIVQGNFVSREAASQMREGMTREQVRYLLGTPLLTDVFHADRWDYVFSFKRGNTQVVQQRRFTVFFDGDRVARFNGDELPSEYELIAEIDGMKRGSAKPAAAAPAPAPAAAPASASSEPPSAPSSSEPAQPQAAASPAPASEQAASSAPAEAGIATAR